MILNCLKKAIKYESKLKLENILRHHLLFMQMLNLCFKKLNACKNNPENFSARKKANIIHVVIKYLQIVHLTIEQINMITAEAKIVWKSFPKT